MASFWQTWAMLRPEPRSTSACRSSPMICSGVWCLPFILESPFTPAGALGLSYHLDQFLGSTPRPNRHPGPDTPAGDASADADHRGHQGFRPVTLEGHASGGLVVLAYAGPGPVTLEGHAPGEPAVFRHPG